MNERQISQLRVAKQTAKGRGGLCLSTEYSTNSSKLSWKCSAGHVWLSPFKNVVSDESWCPDCGREQANLKNTTSDGLDRAKQHAVDKGGVCLSTVYVGARASLDWECSKGHTWSAKFCNVVSNKNWCPKCAKGNLTEEKVRLFFETFYGVPFPNLRPGWNLNVDLPNPLLLPEEINVMKPRKKRAVSLLELDGYCERLKIAFEYDGSHHFNLNGRVPGHQNRLRAYSAVVANDHIKEVNCKANGVLLIRISDPPDSVKKNFGLFLEHVQKACQNFDVQMKFSDSQLAMLEKNFRLM